jgi:hypothetical protein
MSYQFHLPNALVMNPVNSEPTIQRNTAILDQRNTMLDERIAQARAERDALATRLEKGADFLDQIAEREGQDSAEYEKWFAVWLDLDEQYKRADNKLHEITCEIFRVAR